MRPAASSIRRRRLSVASALAAAALVSAAAACTTPPPEFCEGDVRYRYDPVGGAELTTFPDDFYTVIDGSTPTALRVRLDEHNAPWLPDLPGGYDAVFADLNTLDGWGTSAGIMLRFSAPPGELPSGESASVSSDALMLLDLGQTPAKRVPFEVRTTDEGTSAILWPMVPLRPGQPHAVVLTRRHVTPSGSCVSPSPALRLLLAGPDYDRVRGLDVSSEACPPAWGGLDCDAGLYRRLRARYTQALAAARVKADEVSAAVVFTTQSVTDESLLVAEDIRSRTFAWKGPPECTDHALYRVCNAAFVSGDYRREGVIASTTPVATWELPVRLWLPRDTPGPWPVMVFGHGLSGDRGQAAELAQYAAPEGIATVAIDAMVHGGHPTAKGDGLAAVMNFFGIDAKRAGLAALVLRDNWRQSTYDKLQLLRLLKSAPDFDGDGTVDLDVSRLAYYGVSLGGIMGSELLALTDDIGLAILSVPGGRVGSIISDSTMFGLVIEGMRPPGTADGDVDRFFPVLQTLIDRGDASSWAPYVLDRRLVSGSTPPHLLFKMVVGDEVVPNVCNVSLARAMGVPQATPPIFPVGVVPEAALPLSGNLPGGRTAALFQYDRVTRKAGEPPRLATHDNVSRSLESIHQTMHFLRTWLDGKTPEIVDPYAELETPPLVVAP